MMDLGNGYGLFPAIKFPIKSTYLFGDIKDERALFHVTKYPYISDVSSTTKRVIPFRSISMDFLKY
jgi:hypothetical protein